MRKGWIGTAALVAAAIGGAGCDGGGGSGGGADAITDTGGAIDTQAGQDAGGDATVADVPTAGDSGGGDVSFPPPTGTDPLVRTDQGAGTPYAGPALLDLAVIGDAVVACTSTDARRFSPAGTELASVALPGGCTRLAAGAAGQALAVTGDGGVVALTFAGEGIAADGAGYVPQAGDPRVSGVAKIGDTVVAAAGADGLLRIDTGAGTAEPLLAMAAARDVAARGELALVTGKAGALRVVKLTGADATLLGEAAIEDELGPSTGPTWRVDGSGPLVAVTGTHGVALIDVDGPKATQKGLIPLSGAPLSTVSLDGGLLGVAAWGAVELWDIADPAAPRRIGAEEVRQAAPPVAHFSAVARHGDSLVAAGPGGLIVLAVDAKAKGPDLSLDRAVLSFAGVPAGETASGGYLIGNDGTEPLVVWTVEAGDPAFTVAIDSDFAGDVESYDPRPAMVIDPGAKGFLDVSFTAPSDAEITTALTLLTNDPDEEVVPIPMVGNFRRLQAGDPAPEVLLPALDGTMQALSALKGKVVYLKVFSGL